MLHRTHDYFPIDPHNTTHASHALIEVHATTMDDDESVREPVEQVKWDMVIVLGECAREGGADVWAWCGHGMDMKWLRHRM